MNEDTLDNPIDEVIEPEQPEPEAIDEPQGEPEPEPEADDTEEPQGEPEPEATDWKKMSRMWQKRAEGNKKELDAANARIAELEASNARADAVRNAAREANVDEAVLARMTGETPEEIAENARILAAAIPKPSNYPAVNDNGAGSASYGMTLAEINAIKDPTARVLARAQYPNAQ